MTVCSTADSPTPRVMSTVSCRSVEGRCCKKSRDVASPSSRSARRSSLRSGIVEHGTAHMGDACMGSSMQHEHLHDHSAWSGRLGPKHCTTDSGTWHMHAAHYWDYVKAPLLVYHTAKPRECCAVKQLRRARLPSVIHKLQLIQEHTAQLWQSAQALQAAACDCNLAAESCETRQSAQLLHILLRSADTTVLYVCSPNSWCRHDLVTRISGRSSLDQQV